MSEKIYALLLRLYPANFRRMYGEEALQLVRDRMRDERGLWAKARLWWDLLADFAITAPREYAYAPAQLAEAASGLRVGGVPSFWILEDEPMRVGTWGLASILSLSLVGSSAVLMDHAGGHPFGSFARAGRGSAGLIRWAPKESDAGMPQGDPDVELIGNGVVRSQTPGKPGSASDLQMLAVSAVPPSAGARAQYRQTMQETYCTFARVEILPHNVGYMKINSFPDPAVCKTTAEALMARLNGSDAVIFDPRDSKGGHPGMVSLLTGYLFAQPKHLNSPRGVRRENWTRPVTGSRLVNKPVYVLTSRGTTAAAEQFSYNLKILKRATLVGEATRGSAHAVVFHRIDDHFGMGIPEARAKNPYGAGSWKSVGVAPDVKAPAWDAEAVAERLAEKKVVGSAKLAAIRLLKGLR